MLVDTVRALGIIVFAAMVWWLLSLIVAPLWNTTEPLISSQTDPFSQMAVGTLNFLKSVWGYIPFFVIFIVFIWLYVRSQKLEPDTYYYQPPQGGY